MCLCPSGCKNYFRRAFTLVEVLVVIALLGLVFSLLSLSFSEGIRSSLGLVSLSEELKQKAVLFWDLQRKILGAKRIRVEGGNLFMLTSGSSLYEGFVKCAYIYRDGILYYYEFPFPYGAMDEYEEDKLMEVGRFEEFSLKVKSGNRYLESFDGLPEEVVVTVNGQEMVFTTIK